jgi:hypothetical protein
MIWTICKGISDLVISLIFFNLNATKMGEPLYRKFDFSEPGDKAMVLNI